MSHYFPFACTCAGESKLYAASLLLCSNTSTRWRLLVVLQVDWIP
jgi:hypothetical protein